MKITRFEQSSQCFIQLLLQAAGSSRKFAFSQFSDSAHDVRDVFFVLFSFSVQTLDSLTTSIAVYLKDKAHRNKILCHGSRASVSLIGDRSDWQDHSCWKSGLRHPS